MDQTQAWDEVFLQLEALGWHLSTSLGNRLSPLNLLAMVALCLAIYLYRRPPIGFLGWLFPARIYRAASFRVDLKLFVFNWVIGLLLSLVFVGLAAWITSQISTILNHGVTRSVSHPILVTTLIFLTADFTTYWFHRLHHQLPVLWPIHAVHHSAEELNPVTTYRHHPVYEVLGGTVQAIMQGLVQGIALGLIFGNVDPVLLLGTNAFYAIFNLFASNLRHSHIWLRYPGWVEHVLISPAMHQVHHSIDRRHFDRNFGEVLAVWDWAFATLYIPQDDETIVFGLGDGEGQRLPQPHPTFRQSIVVPIRQSWAKLTRR